MKRRGINRTVRLLIILFTRGWLTEHRNEMRYMNYRL